MSFLNKILEKPSYGFTKDGALYVPSHSEIFSEFFRRLNIFKSKKRWLPFAGWTASLLLAVPFFIFLFNYFSWPLLLLGMTYSMVALGTHGTVWLHRYSTHRAYKFKNPFWRAIYCNLVIRIIPEEVYVISHHVHHSQSEQPGDPYNVHGGWLYCFLADVNHQLLNPDLTEREYAKTCALLESTGVWMNTYEQFKKWGSICHPFYTVLHYALNWVFWYGVFYLLGGHALATAIFGCSVIWAFGVRTYNYDGHGGGRDKRQVGIDFNDKDLSINQVWPGYVAGEWHNNHHLYPNGVRSGFLPYQLDLAYVVIWIGSKIGAIHSMRDYKADFMEKHYLPYLAAKDLKIPPPDISKGALV